MRNEEWRNWRDSIKFPGPEQTKQANIISKNAPKKYYGKTEQIHKAIQKSKRTTKAILRRLKQKGIPVLLTATLATGIAGYAITNTSSHKGDDPLPKYSTELGITHEEYEELENILNSLNVDLSQEQLNELGEKTLDLGLNIAKEKFSDATGTPIANITIGRQSVSSNDVGTRFVKISDENNFEITRYTSEEGIIDTLLPNHNKLSEEATEFVDDTCNFQTDVHKGHILRENIGKYTTKIKEFLKYKFMVDDKNNIVTEKVKDDNAKNTKENDIDDDMTR